MQDTLVLKKGIPNFIIEEIEEYTEQTKQGHSKNMKWENIRALLGMAVINNRITREEANAIEKKYCLEKKTTTNELFTKDNLLDIAVLVGINHEIMEKDELWNSTNEQIYNLETYFKSILSKDDYTKFEEFSEATQRLVKCESYIAYQLGLKNGRNEEVTVHNLVYE